MTVPSRRPRRGAHPAPGEQRRRGRQPVIGRGPDGSGAAPTGPGRRSRVAVAAASAPPAPSSARGWGLNKQIVILGIVLCAVALSLAYPLRNYLGQRADLADAVATERSLEQQVTELSMKQAALADPAYLAAEARRRLQYVRPGDTVYVVRAPDTDPTEPGAAGTAAPSASAWYSQLWDTMTASGAAVDPTALQPGTETEPTHISPTITSGSPDTDRASTSGGPAATSTTTAVPTTR